MPCLSLANGMLAEETETISGSKLLKNGSARS